MTDSPLILWAVFFALAVAYPITLLLAVWLGGRLYAQGLRQDVPSLIPESRFSVAQVAAPEPESAPEVSLPET